MITVPGQGSGPESGVEDPAQGGPVRDPAVRPPDGAERSGIPPQANRAAGQAGEDGRARQGGGPGAKAGREDAFTPLVAAWIASLGGLRGLVRQELVSRQLGAHLPDRPLRVLDVGCGQGTQLLRLARAGHRVTGLESSGDMLSHARTALAGEPPVVRSRVRLLEGDGREAGRFFASGSFDLVCCHGVLPHVPDPEPLLASLARVLARGGTLSLLARNGDALAMRPGLAGHWKRTTAAYDGVEHGGRGGDGGRADTLRSLGTMLREFAVPIRTWYGVRVFTDADEHDRPPRSPAELEAVLTCEEEAGRRDPPPRGAGRTPVIGVRPE